jgi:predicted dehydrogenase/threonine dehydrogenase-like Zn-dependent dehydrogenase
MRSGESGPPERAAGGGWARVKQVSLSMKDGHITVLDVPPPDLRLHGVLVNTAWSLISAGTERAKVDLGQKSRLAKARSRPDQVGQVLDKVRREGVLQTYRTVKARLEEQSPIGYSSAGVVTQVGELATGFKPGDRVACGGGEYANHAECAYVPATLCVPVPESVGLDQAVFATVGAVALQGVRQSGVTVGDRVAVIGLGLVGLLTVQLLRAAGCEVAGVDPDAGRCAAAKAFGAAAVTAAAGSIAAKELAGAAAGVGFDAVILTAGTKDDGPIELAGLLARDRGTVVVVGDVGMHVPRAPFYEKELTLKLSRSYGPGRYDPSYEEHAIDYPLGYVRWTEQRNMAEFVRLLAEDRIDVKPLITHRFPVDDAAAAYAAVSQRGASLGVLLEYAASDLQQDRISVGRPAAGEPTSSALGVSFLGAGNFATATLLPALAKDSRFAPRGVFTTSGLSARDVAERHGFSFCAGSADEVLADPQTRAVVVASRHGSHAALAIAAMRAGKAVFVEKPLAVTEAELAEVAAVQRDTAATVTVGFNRRFAPHVRKVVAALAGRTSPATIIIRVNAGAIPDTHWIQQPEVGGGRIVGEVCHFVDLAACLVGAAPARVFAVSSAPHKSPLLSDDLSVTLAFADGSVATVVYTAAGDTAYPKERVEVFCAGNVMIIDDFMRLSLTQGGRTHTTRAQQADKGHRAEMKAFLDLVSGRSVPELTFGDCVSSMAATFKVVESLTVGQPVDVPAVTTGS